MQLPRTQQNPTLLTVNDVKIAVLHYVDEVSSTGTKKLKNEEATYALPVAEAEAIAADIAKARSAGAQLVIVSLRWGSVGKTSPTKDQTALAQAIADSGADIIAGTGTKVIQPVVWLDGKNTDGTAKKVLCAYNLGALLTEDRNKTAYISGVLLQMDLACSWDGTLTFQQLSYRPPTSGDISKAVSTSTGYWPVTPPRRTPCPATSRRLWAVP